ncbi:MAG: hypothetical protein ABIT09_06470 [Croceibacterium sp.]
MNKLAMIVGTAALALGTAGCSKDTPAENEVEKQADAIGDAYKADAKVQKTLAEGAPDEAAQKAAADQLAKKGAAIEASLKASADEMGKDTRKMGETTKSAPAPN